MEPLSAFYPEVQSGGGASSYTSIDYSVTHNGNPSIKVGPDYVRGSREVDGAWVGVKPGDHIVWSAWVKTEAFSSSDGLPGARIGMDFFINPPQGSGVASDANGVQPGHPNDAENVVGVSRSTRLPWGNDWTLLTWDIYVPTTYFSYVYHDGLISCTPTQISSVVVWLDARGVTDNAYAWFSETQLFINP